MQFYVDNDTVIFLLSFITFTGCNGGENDGKNDHFENRKKKCSLNLDKVMGISTKKIPFFNIL
jgi:hypothetical protein